MVTPKCLRLYNNGKNPGFILQKGPITKIQCKSKMDSVPNARIIIVADINCGNKIRLPIKKSSK